MRRDDRGLDYVHHDGIEGLSSDEGAAVCFGATGGPSLLESCAQARERVWRGVSLFIPVAVDAGAAGA